MKKYVNKLMALRLVAFISLISSSLLYAPKPQSRGQIHECIDLPLVTTRTTGQSVDQKRANSIYEEPVIGGNPYEIGLASEVLIKEDEELPPPPVPAKQSQSSDDVGPAVPPKSPKRKDKKNTVAVLEDPTYSPVVLVKNKQKKPVQVQAWLPGADGRNPSVSSAWSPGIYETGQPTVGNAIYVDPQDAYSASESASPARTNRNDAVAARFDGTGMHASQKSWSEDVYDVTAGDTTDHRYMDLQRPTGHTYVDFDGKEDPYSIAQEGNRFTNVKDMGLSGPGEKKSNSAISPVDSADESSTDSKITVNFEEIMGSTDDSEENPYLSHAEAVQIVQKSDDPLLISLKSFWETTFKKSETIAFADFVKLVEYLKPFESVAMMSDQSFQKELEQAIYKTKKYITVLPLKELARQESMFARDDKIRGFVMAILKDDPEKHPFFRTEIGKYSVEKNHLAFLSAKYRENKSTSFQNAVASLIAYIDQAALCIANLHYIRVNVLCSDLKHRLEKIMRDYNSNKINKESSVEVIQELVKAAGRQQTCIKIITDTLKKQSPKLYGAVYSTKKSKPWWKKFF